MSTIGVIRSDCVRPLPLVSVGLCESTEGSRQQL